MNHDSVKTFVKGLSAADSDVLFEDFLKLHDWEQSPPAPRTSSQRPALAQLPLEVPVPVVPSSTKRPAKKPRPSSGSASATKRALVAVDHDGEEEDASDGRGLGLGLGLRAYRPYSCVLATRDRRKVLLHIMAQYFFSRLRSTAREQVVNSAVPGRKAASPFSKFEMHSVHVPVQYCRVYLPACRGTPGMG